MQPDTGAEILSNKFEFKQIRSPDPFTLKAGEHLVIKKFVPSKNSINQEP